MKSNKIQYKGFTLIELMVVVAIVSILLALAIPSFTETLARRRIEGVSNELNADLQYVKTQAVNNNADVSLITNTTGYVISGITSDGNIVYKTLVLNSNLTITQPVTITYNAFRAFPTTAAVLTIGSSQTTASLKISAQTTGRILTCTPSGMMIGYTAC